MKLTILLIAIIAFGTCPGIAQTPEWKQIFLEDLHFTATFPDDPKEVKESISWNVGSGTIRRWTVQLPGTIYEIFVANLPGLSIEDDHNSRLAFFNSVCGELGQGKFQDSNVLFDVLGGECGVRLKDKIVIYRMYLVDSRLYGSRFEVSAAKEKETRASGKKFLDGFLFVHSDESSKKLIWGLPTPNPISN